MGGEEKSHRKAWVTFLSRAMNEARELAFSVSDAELQPRSLPCSVKWS